jgi:hypothetical protein
MGKEVRFRMDLMVQTLSRSLESRGLGVSEKAPPKRPVEHMRAGPPKGGAAQEEQGNSSIPAAASDICLA